MAKVHSNKNSLRKHIVRLSPRGAWVAATLLSMTGGTDVAVLFVTVLRLHRALFIAHEKHMSLLTQQPGKRPLPVPLLAPVFFASIPSVAEKMESEEYDLTYEREADGLFASLMKYTKIDDISTVIENALFLYYGLVSKFLQNHIMLVRDGKNQSLERIDYFSLQAVAE